MVTINQLEIDYNGTNDCYVTRIHDDGYVGTGSVTCLHVAIKKLANLCFCVLMTVTCCLSGSAQDVEIIEVDVKKNPPEVNKDRIILKSRELNEAEMTFLASGQKYWVVRFNKIPDYSTIEVKVGKQRNPVIPEEWYPFKKDLDFRISIRDRDKVKSQPILSYQLSIADDIPVQTEWYPAKDRANRLSREVVHSGIIEFLPPGAAPTPTPEKKATPIPTITPPLSRIQSLWLEYFWPILLAIGFVVTGLLIWVYPYLRDYAMALFNPRPVAQPSVDEFFPKNRDEGYFEERPGFMANLFSRKVKKEKDKDQPSSSNDEREEASSRENTVLLSPSPLPGESGKGKQSAIQKTTIQEKDRYPDQVSETRFAHQQSEQLAGDQEELAVSANSFLNNYLNTLRDFVEGKINETRNLTINNTERIREKVDEMAGEIKQQDNFWKNALGTAKKEFPNLIKSETDKLVSEVKNRLDGIAPQLKQLQSQNKIDLADLEKKIQNEMDQLKIKLEESDRQRSEHEKFYAQNLGLVLSRNVESLWEEAIAELASRASSNLNYFVQEGIVIPERLQALSKTTFDINRELKRVAEVVQKDEKPSAQAAYVKISPYVKNANDLANQLANFQSQAGSRELLLELTVPVSALKGARYTFLEQLGMAVKKELDKWRSPETHWMRKLERVITDNIPNVTEICDTEVAAPGLNPDLEQALKLLFHQAGLTEILPKPGEMYKSGEQDYNQALTGGRSATVASVISRGFTYNDGDQVRLLRKAVVNIYQ